MTNATYLRAAKTATRLLTQYGATMQLRAKDGKSDPVSGSGGSQGATRDVIGLVASVQDGVFTDSLRKAGDRMLILAPESGAVAGEVWVDGAANWPIIELKTIKPDNQTVIAYRALVRG